MRAFSSLVRLVAFYAGLAAANFADAEEPAAAAPGGGLTREALELAGATIRAVHVTVDNVFEVLDEMSESQSTASLSGDDLGLCLVISPEAESFS